MDWSRIPIASFVFFGLFVLASLVHLAFCFLEKEIARKATKCFTTLFLGVAALIAIPNQPLVYLGVFLGMLGDFFLLKKHKVWPFVAGMISFLVGHILYIVAFMILCGPLHYMYYVATALYVIVFPLLFYHVAKRVAHQKKLVIGGTLYFTVLTLDMIWAIVACSNGYVDYCILCAFGGLCFIISDVFLTLTLFKRDLKRRDFYIMTTYLLAQGLIAVGFVFTLLK